LRLIRGRFGGCAVCSVLGPDAESLASFSRSITTSQWAKTISHILMRRAPDTVRFLLLSRSSSFCGGYKLAGAGAGARERGPSLSLIRERRLPPPEALSSDCDCWDAPAKCGATSRAFQSRSRVGAESVFGPRDVSLDDMARGAEGGRDLEGPSSTRLSSDCIHMISNRV